MTPAPVPEQPTGQGGRHDPTHLQGGRRYWATCTCGWKSALRWTLTRALLDHGRHLLAAKETT